MPAILWGMTATDQELLNSLRASYKRIADGDLRSGKEELREMGFHSLKELGDEIDRMERRINSAAGRSPFMPVRRVNL